VKTLDQLIERFAGDPDPSVAELVANGRVQRGFALAGAQKSDDALAAFDDAIDSLGKTQSPALLAAASHAMLGKAATLMQMGRATQAIAACDELVARFGQRSEPEIAVNIASSLRLKGQVLRRGGDLATATTAFEETFSGFKASANPLLREMAAGALYDKAVALHADAQFEEAARAYDQLTRYIADPAAGSLQLVLARALVNSGHAQLHAGASADVTKPWDVLVSSFGQSTDPALRAQVTKALFNKAVLLDSLGRRAEAQPIYDEVGRRAPAPTQAEPADMSGQMELAGMAVLADSARRRMLVDPAELIPQYDLNDLDPRALCDSGKAAGVDAPCYRKTATNLPDTALTREFLGVSCLHAGNDQCVLAEFVALRRMGAAPDILAMGIAEMRPDWLRKPAFKAESTACVTEPRPQRPSAMSSSPEVLQ